YKYLLNDLARLNETLVNQPIPEGAHHDVVSGHAIGIVFPEKVVTKEQLERTQREIEGAKKELAGLDAKLANENFVSRAPANVVESARARQAELRARIEKLMQNQ